MNEYQIRESIKKSKKFELYKLSLIYFNIRVQINFPNIYLNTV